MTAGSRAYTTSYSENLVVGNLAFSVFQIKFAGITINLSWITTMNYTSSKTGEISKIDPQRNCRSMSHVVLSSGNLTNDRYISLDHKTLSSLLTVIFISRAPPYNRRLGLVSAVHAVICGQNKNPGDHSNETSLQAYFHIVMFFLYSTKWHLFWLIRGNITAVRPLTHASEILLLWIHTPLLRRTACTEKVLANSV